MRIPSFARVCRRALVPGVSFLAVAACGTVPTTEAPEQLADEYVDFSLRIPAAERSPAIQAKEEVDQARLSSAWNDLSPDEMAKLQGTVVQRMLEPMVLKLVDGALLADDFQSNEIDLHTWQVMRQQPALSVECEEGALRIHGTIGDERSFGPGFTGIVSRTFREIDVELAARMYIDEDLPSVDGDHLAFVHLCGTQPDFFAHVEAGRRSTEVGPRIGGTARSAADPEGKVVNAISYLPRKWYDVRIRHEKNGDRTQAWISDGTTTTQMLKDAPIWFSSSKAELKVLSSVNGAKVDVKFDDVRMYGIGESASVDIVVMNLLAEGRPQGDVKVEATLLDAAGTQSIPLGTKPTSPQGRCSFVLPSRFALPGRLKLKLSLGDRVVYEGETPKVEGVRGVYPGDVWLVTLGAAAVPAMR